MSRDAACSRLSRWVSKMWTLQTRDSGYSRASLSLGASLPELPFFDRLEDRIVPAYIVVDTLEDVVDADDGVTSLREAIANAAAMSSTQTITFDSTVFASGGTIELRNGNGEISIAAVSGVIIDNDLDDDGVADYDITIDADNRYRVFHLTSGSLTIEGLTLVDGIARTGNGGNILADSGTTLNVYASTITSGRAASQGAGIWSQGTLTVSGSIISYNISQEAGGIYSKGSATITDSMIFENEAYEGSGGGVWSKGTLTVTGSTIRDNYSYYYGGGIYSNGTLTVSGTTISDNETVEETIEGGGGGIASIGTLTVTDSTISGNETPFGGGGIWSDGTLTLTNSTISGNQSTKSGGGLYLKTGSGNSATITNSTLYENSSKKNGGGIYNKTTLTIVNSTLSGNMANKDGGGIYNIGTATLYNTIIANSDGDDLDGNFDGDYNLIEDGTGTFSDGSHNITHVDPQLGALQDNGGSTFTMALSAGSYALNGGSNAIASSYGLTTDQRGEGRFDGSTSSSEGTIDIGAFEFVNPYTITTLDDVVDADDGVTSLREAIANAAAMDTPQTITFDATVFAGGGTIDLVSGNGQITINAAAGLTIDNDLDDDGVADFNITIDSNGYYRNFWLQSGSLAIEGLTLARGNAVSGNGGAIRANTGTTLIVSASTIFSSTARDGGGIWSEGTLTVTNSTIRNGFSQEGGGIYSSGSASIINSTIRNNTAYQGSGGGIFSKGTLTVTNSTMSGNYAYYDGGGIYSDGFLTISGSTINGNESEADGSDGGGGIFLKSGSGNSATITNSTVYDNETQEDGGGIYNKTTLTIVNSTISGNAADGNGGGLTNYGTTTVINSTFSGNSASSGGGIYNASLLYVTNSTLYINSADDSGSGIEGAGVAYLNNTIVAGSLGADDLGGSSGSFFGDSNLIGDSSYLLIDGVNNITGDPLLGGLQDNGGPTNTHLPQTDSPVIDAGDNGLAVDSEGNSLTIDQRGYDRIHNGTVDIGAVEVQDIAPTITVASDLATGEADKVIDIASGISFADDDASDVTITLTVDAGTLFADGPATIGGEGTSTITISGSDSDVTSSLATLQFDGRGLTAQYVTLIATIADGDHAASAGETGTITLTDATPHISIGALPDGVLGQQTTIGSAFSISDDGSSDLTVHLSVSAGTLTAAGAATVIFNGSAVIEITGSLADVMATLVTLQHDATESTAGVVRLTAAIADAAHELSADQFGTFTVTATATGPDDSSDPSQNQAFGGILLFSNVGSLGGSLELSALDYLFDELLAAEIAASSDADAGETGYVSTLDEILSIEGNRQELRRENFRSLQGGSGAAFESTEVDQSLAEVLDAVQAWLTEVLFPHSSEDTTPEIIPSQD